MTKLTKEESKENFDVMARFIYNEHVDEWYDFCEKNRNGKQDIEQISMLVTSILRGYRVVIGKQELSNMLVVFTNTLADITHKMDENEIDDNR